jgi:hypothetical protein
MMTHKQVKAFNRKLRKLDSDPWTQAVQIIKARTVSDASIVAIHLLRPTKWELDRAIEDAYTQNFARIVIHTGRTFGRRN